LHFERRLKLWLWLLGVPSLFLTGMLLQRGGVDLTTSIITLLCFFIAWAFVVELLMEQVTHPLQTLANVAAALRSDDFSFRARGGRRNDAMGDLALELNRLADTLQSQRTGAMEAMALVDRVMSAMPSPVLAFDPEGGLKLLNPAAEQAFDLTARKAIRRNVYELHLEALLDEKDSVVFPPGVTRWLVRRSIFRLHGVPHTLFVLSDIGAALQEEERLAWERLVRVLGHEINNSLAPIKSIAGSLRGRVPEDASEEAKDLHRGLEVIEGRADSLNRFLQAYRQLLGLPSPHKAPVAVEGLVRRVAQLETRLAVQVMVGEDLRLFIDADQVQQALINLVRNATEAALGPDVLRDSVPSVSITWRREGSDGVLAIEDTGPGLTNPANLFVPFYTTKPGGSGIGLALAQQIAQAHKGAVTLTNRDDGIPGCRAELRLPLASSHTNG
jgi:nitrogen fixation/metabolism regulation signal transduction histidine kinase